MARQLAVQRTLWETGTASNILERRQAYKKRGVSVIMRTVKEIWRVLFLRAVATKKRRVPRHRRNYKARGGGKKYTPPLGDLLDSKRATGFLTCKTIRSGCALISNDKQVFPTPKKQNNICAVLSRSIHLRRKANVL